MIRDGELFLIGCRINALRSASTHVQPEADRTKKLLMHKEEIKRLVGKVEQKGFTLVPLNLHYKGGRVKAEIALAKGKAEHDKRDTEKKRDWEREKGRLMRHKVVDEGLKRSRVCLGWNGAACSTSMGRDEPHPLPQAAPMPCGSGLPAGRVTCRLGAAGTHADR